MKSLAVDIAHVASPALPYASALQENATTLQKGLLKLAVLTLMKIEFKHGLLITLAK